MRTAYWAINQEKKETYMSKNLTRKSAAFGAVVALATTLFAGAPAQAAGETISLTPSAGTSFKTILGEAFELSSLFGGWGTAPTALKYFVTGVEAADLVVTAAVSSGVARATSGFANTTATDVTSPTGVTIAGNAVTLGQAAQVKIKLGASVTTTKTVTVTAFNDNYAADGKIDTAGNEVKSATVSITFVKPSEITAVTTLVAPQIGAARTTLKAKVTLGDINIEQLTANNLVTVDFKENGTTITNGGAENANYVKADAALVATAVGVSGNVEANKVYTAAAKINAVASGVGSSGTVVGGDETITSVVLPSTTRSDDVFAVAADDYQVRTGTKTISVSSQAKYTDADGVTAQNAPAKTPALVTISENARNLTTGSTLTAGGKTLSNADSTDTAESISFAAETNAEGKVLFDIAFSTGAKDDTFKVVVQYLSASAYTAAANGDSIYTFVTPARADDRFVRVNAVGELADSSLQAIGVKRGSDFTVTYNLVDKFGKLVVDTTNRRAVNVSASAGTTAINKTVEMINGVAAVTVSDNSASAQNYTLAAKLQAWSGTAWVDSATSGGTAANNASNVTANGQVYAQSSVTPGFMTIAKSVDKPTRATDSQTLVTKLIDRQANQNLALFVLGTGDEVISGTVLSDDGNAAAGVPVTITGAGIQFSAIAHGNNADFVLNLGTITVMTDEAGGYSVKAISQKAGKIAITATSGSLSKSTTPEYAAAVGTAGSAIAISAPAFVSAGGSSTIVVTLTDKFGNPVQTTTAGVERLSVSVTGAGVTGTIPATTDAAGQLRFSQLLGMGDTGSYVVTVKYDADGTGTTNAQISKAATVTIGTAPVVTPAGATAAIAGSTNRMFVSVSNNTLARNVVVKVAGRTVATLKGSTAAKRTYTIRSTKGSKKVTVFVGGKLIATKTISVK
jgi:hypothetical protein